MIVLSMNKYMYFLENSSGLTTGYQPFPMRKPQGYCHIWLNQSLINYFAINTFQFFNRLAHNLI